MKGAKERYERVLLFPEMPREHVHSVYIRLASIYLKEENVGFTKNSICKLELSTNLYIIKYEDAKKLFLHPCKNSPSCMSWLGVGISCYRVINNFFSLIN